MSTMSANTEARTRGDIEAIARQQGAVAVGVADLSRVTDVDPAALDRVQGAWSHAVVCGVRLHRAVLAGIEDRPTPLYMHHYRQANYQLDRMAFLVGGCIQEAGYNALAVPASQIVRSDPLRGLVSHRVLGWAAGLGHIGRSGLLVHPDYGAQMRYVSILTDLSLAADAPLASDCGECRACVERCPAGAIHEQVDDFDLDACYAKLTEFTRLKLVGQHICGVCVKACPGSDSRG
jgi:epoxyqueuosine reductase QueG